MSAPAIPSKASPRSGMVLLIIIVVLVIGAGAYFFSAYHKVTETIDVPPRDRVLKNRFYAAEQFLQAQDIVVRKAYGVGRLTSSLATGRAIVVPNYGQYDQLSDDDVDNLIAWAYEGGHVIVLMNTDRWDGAVGQPLLLSQIGVEHNDSQFSGAEEDVSRFIHQDKEYTVELGGEQAFKSHGNYPVKSLAVNDYGNQAIQLSVGDGLISLLNDEVFMRNPSYYEHADHYFDAFGWYPEHADEHIGTADNALFLSTLLSGVQSLKIIQRRQESEQGLFSWLWSRAAQVVLSLGLLGLVWLWWLRNRFGPIFPIPGRSRRNYLDHLLATTRFLWSKDKGQQLLAQERHELQQRLARRHPYLNHLYETDVEQLCVALMQKQQQRSSSDDELLTAEHIQLALFASDKDQRQFIDISYYQQSLRAIL